MLKSKVVLLSVLTAWPTSAAEERVAGSESVAAKVASTGNQRAVEVTVLPSVSEFSLTRGGALVWLADKAHPNANIFVPLLLGDGPPRLGEERLAGTVFGHFSDGAFAASFLLGPDDAAPRDRELGKALFDRTGARIGEVPESLWMRCTPSDKRALVCPSDGIGDAPKRAGLMSFDLGSKKAPRYIPAPEEGVSNSGEGLSPTGAFIHFEGFEDHYVFDLAHQGLRAIGTLLPGRRMTGGVVPSDAFWAPGDKLLVWTESSEPNAPKATELVAIDVRAWRVAWSRPIKEPGPLAAAHDVVWLGRPAVRAHSLKSGAPVGPDLSTSASALAVSPDGSLVAFQKHKRGAQLVYWPMGADGHLRPSQTLWSAPELRRVWAAVAASADGDWVVALVRGEGLVVVRLGASSNLDGTRTAK